MNDKKNIDRFFQEKFKDFESEPKEVVWKNIEANLKNKKSKRRIIPFWLQLSGVAAAFIIAMFSINNYFSINIIENKVVLEEKSSKSATKNDDSKIEKAIVNQNENQMNAIKNNNVVVVKKANDSRIEILEKNDSSPKDKVEIFGNKIIKNEGNALKNKVEDSKKTNTFYNPKNTFRKNQIANKAIKLNTKQQNQFFAFNKSKTAENNFAPKNAENKDENLKNDQLSQSKINGENKMKNKFVSTDNLVENKDLLIQKIDKEKIADKKLDAVAKVESLPNALEELLKKKEEEKKKVTKAKLERWQVTSNVAPIYLSSTSSGSPIDAEFAQNKKTYDNNLSLGLGVNYAVNKKIKIRSGVNKLTLGYSTKDVVFQAGLSAKSMANISNSANGAPINITNKGNSIRNLMAFEQNIDSFNEGQINQKMGYYEVPLEVSYALVNKKFGINLIGGLSTLFLTENSVSVSSSNMSADIGKANNLNNVHFSTNFGLGFRYRFFRAFEAKLEPTFKYQINTFSNDVGGFKPYFIGLYSGLSFSF